jgi:hypothetical protein
MTTELTDDEALDQLYRWLYDRGIKRLQAQQEREKKEAEAQDG